MLRISLKFSMVKELPERNIQEWLLHKYVLILVTTLGLEITQAMVGSVRRFS